jgi:hypothetical protein
MALPPPDCQVHSNECVAAREHSPDVLCKGAASSSSVIASAHRGTGRCLATLAKAADATLNGRRDKGSVQRPGHHAQLLPRIQRGRSLRCTLSQSPVGCHPMHTADRVCRTGAATGSCSVQRHDPGAQPTPPACRSNAQLHTPHADAQPAKRAAAHDRCCAHAMPASHTHDPHRNTIPCASASELCQGHATAATQAVQLCHQPSRWRNPARE